MCRFYPEEYSILTRDYVSKLLEEEGYHAILDPALKSIKDFQDKVFYLSSRGVPKKIAEKWASLSYKDLVYYKPYFEVLDLYCRSHEIYPDPFYEEVEGIDFSEIDLKPKRTSLIRVLD